MQIKLFCILQPFPATKSRDPISKVTPIRSLMIRWCCSALQKFDLGPHANNSIHRFCAINLCLLTDSWLHSFALTGPFSFPTPASHCLFSILAFLCVHMWYRNLQVIFRIVIQYTIKVELSFSLLYNQLITNEQQNLYYMHFINTKTLTFFGALFWFSWVFFFLHDSGLGPWQV